MATDAERQAVFDNAGRISKSAFKITVGLFFGIAVSCTIARFVIRGVSRRMPTFDDYLVLLGTAALSVSWGILLNYLDVLYIVEALNEDETAIALLRPDDLNRLLMIMKWNSIFVAMDWLCIFSIKFAFLYFFHGLVWKLSRALNYYFWAITAFNIGAWLGLTFADFAICPYVGDAAMQCASNFNHNTSVAVTISSNAINIVCDIMVVTIPILALQYSTMRTTQKLGVAAILCLSIVMIVFCLIRLVGSVATTKTTNLGTAPVWGTYWQVMEGCVAVIMASIIIIRSVFIKKQNSSDNSPPAHTPIRYRIRRTRERLSSSLRSEMTEAG